MTYEQSQNPDLPRNVTSPPPPPPPNFAAQQYMPPAPQNGPGAPQFGAPAQPPHYNPAPQQRYTHDGVPLATTGVRVAARLIDFVLLGLVSMIGGMISSAAFGSTLDYDAYKVTSGLIGLVVALGSIAYFLVGESVFGTTLGKLILGLKVRSVQGGQLSPAQAFKRNTFVLPMYLGSAISALVLLGSNQDLAGALTSLYYGGTVGVLGTIATIGLSIAVIVTISNSPVLQGFHDKLAGSSVVTTR